MQRRAEEEGSGLRRKGEGGLRRREGGFGAGKGVGKGRGGGSRKRRRKREGGGLREEAGKALTQQGPEKFTQWAPEKLPGGHQHLPGSQDGEGRCFWKYAQLGWRLERTRVLAWLQCLGRRVSGLHEQGPFGDSRP